MDGSRLIVENKKILNYNEVISFINNINTTSSQLDLLALDIEAHCHHHNLDPHSLLLASTILVNIQKQQSLYPSTPTSSQEMQNGAGMDRGYAKVMRGPGTPKRRENPSFNSIINFPNGSALAVGLMMLNVVIVGIMYIIMAIAKIGG